MLLGHAKIDSAGRYLGVRVEDALELGERTEVWTDPNQILVRISGCHLRTLIQLAWGDSLSLDDWRKGHGTISTLVAA